MTSDETDYAYILETDPLASNRLTTIESDIQIWADKPIEFSFDPTGTHLFSLEELMRAFAKRAADFSKSVRSLLADKHVIPATIVGRALIETVGAACLFLHDMSRLIAAGDRQRVDDRLERFYAGAKGKNIEPVHVMDAIRHLDKIDAEYVKYLDSRHNMFSIVAKIIKTQGHDLTREEFLEGLSVMKNYDLLSEVSHPNGAGTQLMYGQSSPSDEAADKIRRRFYQASLMSIWTCHHMLVALDKNADISERYREKFISAKQS
jgi:hypothetical protein